MLEDGQRIGHVSKEELERERNVQIEYFKTPWNINNGVIRIHLLHRQMLVVSPCNCVYDFCIKHERQRCPRQTHSKLNEEIQKKETWLNRACPEHI